MVSGNKFLGGTISGSNVYLPGRLCGCMSSSDVSVLLESSLSSKSDSPDDDSVDTVAGMLI